MNKIQLKVIHLTHFLLLSILMSLSISSAYAANIEDADVKTATLAVEHMTCAMCPITVRKSLTNLDGVIDASVNYDDKTAKVTYHSNKVSIDKLTQATTNVGYPSTLKQ